MKELLKKLEEAEKRANEAMEAAWEKGEENEELEKAFDEAYKAEWEAFDNLANEIVKITAGAIDKKTAQTMIKAKRAELKNLIERIA